MVLTSDTTGTHAIKIAALFCVMCDLSTVMNFLYLTLWAKTQFIIMINWFSYAKHHILWYIFMLILPLWFSGVVGLLCSSDLVLRLLLSCWAAVNGKGAGWDSHGFRSCSVCFSKYVKLGCPTPLQWYKVKTFFKITLPWNWTYDLGIASTNFLT